MTKFVYNNAKHTFIKTSLFEININYNFKKCYEKKIYFKSQTSTALNQIKKLRFVDDAFRETLK